MGLTNEQAWYISYLTAKLKELEDTADAARIPATHASSQGFWDAMPDQYRKTVCVSIDRARTALTRLEEIVIP